MPFDLQTRLLRVLADGQFYRVGGHNPMKSNVRVIAATHQDLEQRVKAGAFREDLFHRLNVIRLRLPALRERTEDIAPLARFFLQKSARELGVEGKRLTDAAIARLVVFDYPGNVRQLENICHWLTVMAPAQLVDAKDLPPELQPQAPTRADAAPRAAAVDAEAPIGGSRRRRSRRAAARGTVAPPRRAADGAGADGARSGWLGGLEQRARELLQLGRADGLGHADARVRGAADPLRARADARPSHRGRAQARHRPQHDHAQDPGARPRREVIARRGLSRRDGARPCAARRPHLDERLDRRAGAAGKSSRIGAVEARPPRRDDP